MTSNARHLIRRDAMIGAKRVADLIVDKLAAIQKEFAELDVTLESCPVMPDRSAPALRVIRTVGSASHLADFIVAQLEALKKEFLELDVNEDFPVTPRNSASPPDGD